jgi:septal ring factor EnvC (AmiA/AmiB activator)
MAGTIQRCYLHIAVLAAAACSGASAFAQSDEERALEAVRKEIHAVEERVARQTTARNVGLASLRGAEVAIAGANRELARIRTRLGEQRAREAALAADAKQAAARMERERAALARQVQLSYMTGREELFKLLLSQESPATLGRMLVYYDYFNRARSARIAAVSIELAKLAALATQSARVAAELEQLLEAQSRELQAHERARAERGAALAQLEASIPAAGGEIEALRLEEERLSALVLELGELLAGFPRGAEEPFAALKGRLAWPLEGRLSQTYGQLRGGGPLRWNGVLLTAAAGAAVRAIYHGRVAFADWLPGLGLLIIIDHGEGYMSLYGHNEALLKESGEWVAPGDPIAQVGDSGGQAEPALYFEIRHDGKPVDPRQWMGRDTERR